jgi:surface antigen
MQKILCALVLLTLATPLMASDPFAGTWTLNSAKTKYTTGTPPKNVTIVIEEQGANLQVTATGTSSDGSPISVSAPNG